MKKLAVMITLFCSLAGAQIYQPISGWCQLGGKGVAAPVTLGTSPVQQFVQASYKGCTITIFVHGTNTTATLYSTSNGTTLTNPFQADTRSGFYQAFAGTGFYDIQESGTVSPPVSLGSVSVIDVLEPINFKNQNNIRYSSQFPGSDCGQQINGAYGDLPSNGGTIIQDRSCTFAVPIAFTTNNKPVILRGLGDTATQLTYTGVGAAITLDYGTGLLMAKGIRDLYLTGPGSGTSTTGIRVGVTNGAQGTLLSGLKIESFGTNLTFGNNTWIVKVDHSLIRNGNINVLFPACSNCGENMQWDHVTFADQPTLATGQVQLLSGDHRFDSCSFDNSPLVVGDSTTAAVQVEMYAPHFENPNYASITGWHDFVTIRNVNGAQVTMFGPTFEQDSSAITPVPQFITAAGGSLYLYGSSLFTPVGPITQFINTSGIANITIYGLNDLSGQIAKVVGGTSTGYLVQFPGTNINNNAGFNNVIGPGAGTNQGGTTLDITGGIRSTYKAGVANSGQFVSTAPAGTPPLTVNSPTMVFNLTTGVYTYLIDGTQSLGDHMVRGNILLTAGSATVSLVAAAVYSNLSTYVCTGVDTSSVNPVRIIPSSGSDFTITGTGTDNIAFSCIGN